MTILGERLSELREDKKITQEELGKILNVSKSTISSWENGRTQPSNEYLVALGKIFNVSVDYLIGKTRVPSPNRLVSFLVDREKKTINITDENVTSKQWEMIEDYLRYIFSK